MYSKGTGPRDGKSIYFEHQLQSVVTASCLERRVEKATEDKFRIIRETCYDQLLFLALAEKEGSLNTHTWYLP